MQVTLKLFAAAREAAGWDEQVLDMPDGSTVAELRRMISGMIPLSSALLDASAVAVNQQFVRPQHALKEGDEVAVLPPVSGG
jgi:molybdopterin converting factor subunit 1